MTQAPHFSFHRLLTLLALSSCLWTSFHTPTLVYADNIEIDGITIPCVGCIIYGDGRCAVPVKGEKLLLNCSRALDLLMFEAAMQPELAAQLSLDSLNRYLFSKPREIDAAAKLFGVILSRKEGEAFFVKNLPRILSWYSEALRENLLAGSGITDNKVLLRSIFDQPEDGTVVRAELRIIAALSHPDITLKDVAYQLGFSNASYELDRILLWVATADLLEHEWAGAFRQTYKILKICGQIDESKIFPPACYAKHISQMGGAFSGYLNKFVVRAVHDQIRRENLVGVEVLQRLRNIDYSNGRTPVTHTLVSEALTHLADNPLADEHTFFLSEETKQFFLTLSEYDFGIAEQYFEFLIRVGMSLWSGEKFSEALELIDQSFILMPNHQEVRAKLLRMFWAQKEFLKPDVMKQLETQHDRESHYGWAWVAAASVGCIVLILAGLYWRYRYLIYSRTSAQAGLPVLSFRERYELKEILSYFGLTVSANQDDLGRAYRVRAKALHPDSNTGNIQEFNALTSRYQRARSLFQKVTHS